MDKIIFSFLVLCAIVACKEEVPNHTPYLLDPNGCQGTTDTIKLCPRYKLVDKALLQYAFDTCAPCTDVTGGYGLPPGEFEKIAAWGRSEVKNCTAAKAKLEEMHIPYE